MPKRRQPKTVLEAFANINPTGPLRHWAESMGSDFRRAWRECDNAVWLLYLAWGLGVPGRTLVELHRGYWTGRSEPVSADVAQAMATPIERLREDEPLRRRLGQALVDAAGERSEADWQRENEERLALLRSTFDIEKLLDDQGDHTPS